MKAVVLYNAIPANAPDDEIDTIVQAEAVLGALRNLGFEAELLALSLDLSQAAQSLRDSACGVVFNLVEGLDGESRLLHVGAGLLNHLRIPYTGCHMEALQSTTNKVIAKKILLAHQIPTAAWISEGGLLMGEPSPSARYLLKPVDEDASIGLEEDQLALMPRGQELNSELRKRGNRTGYAWFAEEFLDGREFNVSVLETENGPTVLPPAEMVFRNFPVEKPRVIGYRAKWDKSSFEYEHTVREFPERPADQPILDEVRNLSLQCWSAFGLRGYARVDIRLDSQGNPRVLEINANPCIAPDAGYVAAAARAGIKFTEIIRSIVSAALR